MTWEDVIAGAVVFMGLASSLYVVPFGAAFLWRRWRAWWDDRPSLD